MQDNNHDYLHTMKSISVYELRNPSDKRCLFIIERQVVKVSANSRAIEGIYRIIVVCLKIMLYKKTIMITIIEYIN